MTAPVLRAWPWTIALCVVLAGFVAVGVLGINRHTSVVTLLVSLVVTLLAVFALVRAASLGVRITPSGLIVRELTKSTALPWSNVRAITCEKSRGRGYVPVLRLQGTGADRVELTVLAAYSEAAAQRRTDVLATAYAATRKRRRT